MITRYRRVKKISFQDEMTDRCWNKRYQIFILERIGIKFDTDVIKNLDNIQKIYRDAQDVVFWESEFEKFLRESYKKFEMEVSFDFYRNLANDADITGFDVNDVIGGMMVPGKAQNGLEKIKPEKGNRDGTVKKRKPHTIRQVYDMCKSYSCTDEINHQKVGYILFDERSAYMYPRGIFGKRLVEARCRRYFYESDSIFLETPINEEKYELELKIRDKKLFKKVKDMLYNNRSNVLVVAGDWQPSGIWNRFVTEFNAMSQIKIFRQKFKWKQIMVRTFCN